MDRLPRRAGWYDLTTHFPWIGERTRALDGAHVEFFRGIQNPVAIKLGPTTTADQVLRLIDAINPNDEPGKIALVTRMERRVWRTRFPAWSRSSSAPGVPLAGV